MDSRSWPMFICLLLFYNAVADNIPDPMPQTSDGIDPREDIQFFLYTRRNPKDPQQLIYGDRNSLKNSNFDKNVPTIFTCHGWQTNGNGPLLAVKDGLLANGDYNVIAVDWGQIAETPDYVYAASRVKAVGEYISMMMDFMHQRAGFNMRYVTLVGHSLGAHVAGLASYAASQGNRLKVRLPHVVGLDPARAGFTKHTTEGRIDKKDATLVEIMHTAAGRGFEDAIGDVDYYVNNGSQQPGCGNEKDQLCSHDRAISYYAESWSEPSSWKAINCDTYSNFQDGKCEGNAVVPLARLSADFPGPKGIYRLRTSSSAPYGLGYEGVRPS